MPIILGIDPGLQCTGWGVIAVNGNHLRHISCGIIKTDSKADLGQRLEEISTGISKVIGLYTPEQAAIEETFVNKNPMSSLKLGHARGALMLTIAQARLPLSEYSATLVKKSVVGVGRAEKGQVMMMIRQLLPAAEIERHDAADALAVAICHANHKTLLT